MAQNEGRRVKRWTINVCPECGEYSDGTGNGYPLYSDCEGLGHPPAETVEVVPNPAEEIAERHNALVYARRHLQTHVDWRDHLKAGGELPDPLLGDLEHHEQAIRELNTICKVLRSLR